jgi:hypothetical protein
MVWRQLQKFVFFYPIKVLESLLVSILFQQNLKKKSQRLRLLDAGIISLISDGANLVFGIPLAQCIANDRLSEGTTELRRRSHHGSRTSCSSLAEAAKPEKVGPPRPRFPLRRRRRSWILRAPATGAAGLHNRPWITSRRPRAALLQFSAGTVSERFALMAH